jgi:glycosyltransferase involved in cell wall biosynthesis
MRIGVNLLPLGPDRSGGIEWYARSLVRSLRGMCQGDELYLFTNRESHESFGPDSPGVQRVLCPVEEASRGRRILYEQVQLPRLADELSIDVLHSPFYTWPLRCSRPGVVTICDMLYKVHPHWVGQPRLTFWRMFVPRAADRCRRIVTLSENSKDDIVRFLRVSPEKVVVTPLAADAEFERMPTVAEVERVKRLHGIEGPYVLTVGGMRPHKNTLTLLQAFRRYSRSTDATKLTLVVTGRDYGAKSEVEAAIALSDCGDRVRVLGYVARADLPALYRGALMYVSMSFFEGFGLTALEAMSCGTPVIVSKGGALPEVVGGAGIVLEPTDVDGLAEAIALLARDDQLRGKLSEEGTARAKEFSWTRTARGTLEAYRAAVCA